MSTFRVCIKMIWSEGLLLKKKKNQLKETAEHSFSILRDVRTSGYKCRQFQSNKTLKINK